MCKPRHRSRSERESAGRDAERGSKGGNRNVCICSCGTLFKKVGEKRNCLNSLAQAHLVCEDGVDVLLIQEGEPIEANELVRLELASTASPRKHEPTPRFPSGATFASVRSRLSGADKSCPPKKRRRRGHQQVVAKVLAAEGTKLFQILRGAL